MQVIKRDGTKQAFDINKIKNAIKKALYITNKSDYQLDQIVFQVESLLNEQQDSINIEDIQDAVENTLMS